MELRPGYKQTEVGVIPEDWDAVKMEAITEHIGDGLHGTPIYCSNGGYSFINGNNLNNGKIFITSDTRTVDHSEFIKYRKHLNDRSILMSINGTIGNLAMFDGEAIVLGKSAAYLNVKQEISKSFVYYSLQTETIKRQFFDGMTGSTIGNLGLSTIRSTQIPLPPTETEQRAIAAALSDVDALISGLDRLIAKKRDIKQAAMQQLLTGKQRLPGFSGEWEKATAGEIGRFRGGCGFALKYQGQNEGTYPFYKVSDMNNEGNETFMIDSNHWISAVTRKTLGATVFPANSIVFAKVGAAIFLERKKILSRQSCIDNNMTAFVLDTSRAECRFIHYLLLSTKLGALVATTALPSINGKQLAEIPIALPPLLEQTAIATVLSDMDADITTLEARRDKTRALKQGMMQELLTGRIRLV